MSKIKRWSIERVNEFVEKNSECELLSSEYRNTVTKMWFRCKCGNEFKTSFKEFKDLNKRQCNECGNKRSNAGRTYSIERINNYLERFGCKLLSEKYVNCKEPLLFRCKCGKEFEATFDIVKNGGRDQCYECSPRDGSLFKRGFAPYNLKDHDDFVVEMKAKYRSEYEVLGRYVDAKTKLEVRHECGHIYETTPDNILNKERGCPECYTTWNSHLSMKVKKWLTENGIQYVKEHRFHDCRNPKTDYQLPFDFYLSELNTCIEVDGEQHYKPFRYIKDIDERNENFRNLKKRDEIKNMYCEKNNIKLIRIPYFKENCFEQILQNKLNM